MRRTSCGGCGHGDLRTFLDLGSSPIADAYTSTATELSPTYPLDVAVCSRCWLVQLLEVVDHDVLFGTGYSFYSSASAPLSAYHARYADDIMSHHVRNDDAFIVEVGCNDGDMLRHFAKCGHRVLGVDPSSGPVGLARSRGLNVVCEAFTYEVAQRLRDEHGSADVIIANHVLAHVADVSSTLRGVHHLLATDGVAFIEVQYLPDLLLNNAFDLVYHEHRNFFSLSSLTSIAQLCNLHVSDVQLTGRQGGSLRVTLRREPTMTSARAVDVHERESWVRSMGAYANFQGRAERVRDRLHDTIDKYLHTHSTIIGYGAPAKATTLLNFCDIDHTMLRCVVDTTQAKQGRFIPGVRVPILSPTDVDIESDVDVAVILAWNYTAQITRNNVAFTRDGGTWIVPIPVPTTL